MKKAAPKPAGSPAQQLSGFLAEFTPEIATRARTALKQLRQLVPPSVEMVYDNYNFLVVGFSPTPRPSEAVLSLALYARGIGLCFLHGAKLPDPHGILRGSGKQVRSIKIITGEELADPRVQETIRLAVEHAPVPYPRGSKRRLVIKSISPKRRARRPSR